jgi:dihydroflavonol-4-reductase
MDVVIHAAAYVQLGWANRDLHFQINTEGAANVARSSRRAGARMIHVSSVDALGIGWWDRPANEEVCNEDFVPCPYVMSKRAAEAEIRREIDDGLNAVIVNLGFMLGPWDWKPSSGRMLLQVAQRFMPVAPCGGFSVCDVRDVARAVLVAMADTPSSQYILGGNNLTYHATWKLFADVAGARGPWLRSGFGVLPFIAGRLGDLWGKVTGHEPEINSAATAMSRQPHYFDSSRAIAELGYRIRPARESVQDAWDWFRQYGYA